MGDSYHKCIEFINKIEKQDVSNKAKKLYEEAMKIAAEELSKAHPLYLKCALNYSSLLYDIDHTKESIDLLKKTYHEVKDSLNEINGDNHSEVICF